MRYGMEDAMRGPMRGAMDGALGRAFQRGLSPQIASSMQSRAAGHEASVLDEALRCGPSAPTSSTSRHR